MIFIAQTQIKVRCTDQMLEFIESPIVASGGFNEDKVIFEFCPLWDNFTKTAVFYVKKDEAYEALVDEENTCIIPHEVLQNPGKMFFGVFGVNSDSVTRTSETVKYKIVQGAITEDLKPSDPTPDIYEQILARVNFAITGIENIQESDEDGGENVVTFTDGHTMTVKNGKTGSAGKDGAAGKDGTSVTITSVKESPEDGGDNIVTFSDGKTLTVKNGVSGAGANIVVDAELSATSENPVQNKAVSAAFGEVETQATEAFQNVFASLRNKQETLVSSENIKTINGESILGEGDLEVGISATEEDNGKVLQVVDGVVTPVTLEDSSIKTYIDDYINEALGGEY